MTEPRSRVRVRYAKEGKLGFLSHRDVARVWERTLRKAELPVAYSEGFSPRPRLHFGLALPTGAVSDAEYLDVDLRTGPDDGCPPIDQLTEILTAAMPPGLRALAAVELPAGTDSLQEAVAECRWELELVGCTDDDVAAAVERVGAATELPLEIERKGRRSLEDLRPLVFEIVVAEPAEGPVVRVDLGTRPRSVRLGEVVEVMGVTPVHFRARRTHQWIHGDAGRIEPIALAAAAARTPETCAS